MIIAKKVLQVIQPCVLKTLHECPFDGNLKKRESKADKVQLDEELLKLKWAAYKKIQLGHYK